MADERRQTGRLRHPGAEPDEAVSEAQAAIRRSPSTEQEYIVLSRDEYNELIYHMEDLERRFEEIYKRLLDLRMQRMRLQRKAKGGR